MLARQSLPRLVTLEPAKWLSTRFIPLKANKGISEVTEIALIDVVIMSFDFTNLLPMQIAEITN